MSERDLTESASAVLNKSWKSSGPPDISASGSFVWGFFFFFFFFSSLLLVRSVSLCASLN